MSKKHEPNLDMQTIDVSVLDSDSVYRKSQNSLLNRVTRKSEYQEKKSGIQEITPHNNNLKRVSAIIIVLLAAGGGTYWWLSNDELIFADNDNLNTVQPKSKQTSNKSAKSVKPKEQTAAKTSPSVGAITPQPIEAPVVAEKTPLISSAEETKIKDEKEKSSKIEVIVHPPMAAIIDNSSKIASHSSPGATNFRELENLSMEKMALLELEKENNLLAKNNNILEPSHSAANLYHQK